MKHMNKNKASLFTRFSSQVAKLAGKPVTFILATITIVIWGVTGPIFHYSDTWQLVINTGTTIITFLMVFLIQNTQNRDSVALQLKLDELIHVTRKARNVMMEVEDLDEKDLLQKKGEMVKLAHEVDEAEDEIDEAKETDADVS
jgi:low affinity Fe/Cu permease